MPYQIVNFKPECFRAGVLDCSANIRLNKREAALLRFYSECSTGFCPALKTVYRYTGIRPNKISEIRQRLRQKNLISIQGNNLVINWNHILALANIDRLSKHAALTGIWQNKSVFKSKMIKDYYRADPWYKATKENQSNHFIKIVESMTVKEYYEYLGMAIPRPRY